MAGDAGLPTQANPADDRRSGITPGQRETIWLDYRNPEYQESEGRWRYVEDHYTGRVGEIGTVAKYLVQRPVGEPREAFAERKKLADYTPHYSAIVDALAGMLFSVEEDANRTFIDKKGRGIGDPQASGTMAWRLWRDADGEGNGWLTKWKQLAIELINQKCVWILVDTSPSGDPRVKVIAPLEVLNWRKEAGRTVEVLIREERDVRGSLRDKPREAEGYVYFTLDGWTRYHINKTPEGNRVVVEDESGTYTYTAPDGRPALPIYEIELPMRRHVGYLLARKANAIFNKESERDHILRVANFPILNLYGSDETVKTLEKALRNGARALQVGPEAQSGHEFIAPSSESAKIASDVLERKVEEFYVTAFREYGDAAREKTATEVKQDISAGVGAFLQMLKAAVDDAEAQAMWRIEQQQFPTDKTQWYRASVSRSNEFSPLNVNEVVKRLKERYFGTTEPMPVGKIGMFEAAKMIAEFDGVKFDEEEMAEAVQAFVTKDHLDSLLKLEVPAAARARIVLSLVEAVTGVDMDQGIDMENGANIKLGALILEQATSLAEATDQARARQAQGSPFAPPAGA